MRKEFEINEHIEVPMSLYKIYKKLTNEDLREFFNKADTVEEKDFWSSLLQLRLKEIQIKKMYNDS